jgi:DNA polymerase I-like protein with 3'-5' exonuclease and polymerase domains
MTWEPPADPDLENLALTAWSQWNIDRPATVAFDTETTGLEYHDVAFGASIAWVHNDVLTGPVVRGHWFDFTVPNAEVAVRRILSAADNLVAHNAKFDLHKLETTIGWTLRPSQTLHDTEAMAHLDDEHRSKGLKSLAISVLGFDDTIEIPGKAKGEDGKMVDVMRPVPKSKWEIDEARKWAKKLHGLGSVQDVGYDLLPRGTLVPYAVLDAEWTFNLAAALYPRVAQYPDLLELYEREILLTRGAIYDLEREGMATDVAYVERMVKDYRKRCIQHELDIEQIVGRPVRTGSIPPKERGDWFNPNASSPDAAALLAAAGHDRESYDAGALEGIDHPLARKLLTYRKDVKILDSYFVALQRDTGPDGVFHPSLRQHGTVSGRTSAGAERGD